MKFHRTTEHPKRVGGTREAITISSKWCLRQEKRGEKREKSREEREESGTEAKSDRSPPNNCPKRSRTIIRAWVFEGFCWEIWGLLGCSLELLGSSLELLGSSLGALGVDFGALGDDFGSILRLFTRLTPHAADPLFLRLLHPEEGREERRDERSEALGK